MRFPALAAIFLPASLVSAQPLVDNVLERMVPPGVIGIVGAHMDRIKQTELYRKMLAARNLPQVDQFAAETGFDPRRDVRELLFVTTVPGPVMLARGTFHPNSAALKSLPKSVTRIRHGQYDIFAQGRNGFCILDATLAAAGDVSVLEAALDEWTSGTHTAARPLLERVAQVNPQSQIWGISTGAANFLADHPPAAGAGIDLSRIFQSLQDTWFQADFTNGVRSEVHGTTATEKDAISLRDAVRGIVGLGRLNVPENQPELLKAWDGIAVEQQGRSIALRTDIPQDLIDRMLAMLSTGASGVRRLL